MLGAGPILAVRLMQGGTVAWRGAAVAVGVLSMVPWMAVVVNAIRRGDEFTRRIHLISASIALGGTVLMMSAVDWLARADFIERPDLMLLWVASLLIWAIALLGVKRHFERAL